MLVISEQVARRAGLDVTDWPQHELTLRNRREPLVIRVLEDIRRLGAAPRPPGARATDPDARPTRAV